MNSFSLGSSVGSSGSTAASRQDAFLLQIGRSAMACEFEVLLNMGENPQATDHAMEALDLVERLEQALTIYRPESELSRLNARAFQENVPLSDVLWELFDMGDTVHRWTEGGFDLTSASLTEIWGFHRRAGRMPKQEEIEVALQGVGNHRINLNRNAREVRFLAPSVKVNPGGIGKGIAIQRAARLLADSGVANFLIHGGMSSIMGMGNRRKSEEESAGWLIALRHPLQPETLLGHIRLRNQALGTSGPANQFFHFQGKRYGHIIDPRTGWPAEGFLSTTVICQHAGMADALATGLFVMGPNHLERFARIHPEVGIIAVTAGNRQGSFEVQTWNLSPGTWLAV